MIYKRLEKATVDDLYEVTLLSSSSKEKQIYIYEITNLSEIVGFEKAEILRKEFLKNKIKVKQLTNLPVLPKFTENDKFVNSLMEFRYVPKEVFEIYDEILIFDDVVALYNTKPEIKLMVIKDKNFAKNQKQLFMNLWAESAMPRVSFKYCPNHSYYNQIDYKVFNKPLIIYPDSGAKTAYKDETKESLCKDISKIIIDNSDFYKNYDYLIGFIWSDDGKSKMIDLWMFSSNHVDDRSGPLGDVKVFKNGNICNMDGLVSGNTLIILGYEERLRRQSGSLTNYLKQVPPKLPFEMMNGRDFFKD
jgi:hypothetical protein